MNILHLNSYYFTNKVHLQFRKQIDDRLSFRNRYFIPTYDGASHVFEDKEIAFFPIYRKYDKILFFSKIFKSVWTVTRRKLHKEINVIHAHTLISDGLIALVLNILFGIKYCVTVRNTDVNFFLPNNLFRFLGKLVSYKAARVICVSPSYKIKMQEIFPGLSTSIISVLPNGVNQFWLDNIYLREKEVDFSVVKIVFVGRVDQNKNIDILLSFLQKYNDRQYELTVVGENLMQIDFDEFNKRLNNGNRVVYLGAVSDMNRLMRIYRDSHVFAMLSLKETFGVTYVEAMSQGLPIMYTENEGFDGFFDNGGVGVTCDPISVESIKSGMDRILTEYNKMSTNCTVKVERFGWEMVSKEYGALIDEIK